LSSDRDKLTSVWAQVAYYSGLGFIVPGGIAAGYVAGWLLDRWLGTAPIFAIVCAALGAAGGFIEVLRILLKAEKREDREQSGGNSTEG
jgi:F0F1-type ATP synthase assembly protein I